MGCHERIPQEDRVCQLSELGQIEFEYHVLINCPLYNDVLEELIAIVLIVCMTLFTYNSIPY